MFNTKTIGFHMHKGARIIAAFCVLVYVIAADLYTLAAGFAKWVYTQGYRLGTWVHNTNDALASYSVLISAGNLRAVYNKLTGIMLPVQQHPLALLAEEVSRMTIKELRRGVKAPAKYKKQDIINLYMALV